jgi:hypothetical protein
VAMLNNSDIVRENNIVKIDSFLKKLDFYKLDSDNQKSLLSSLDKNSAYSCHRQNELDFASLAEVTVISIVLDQIDFLFKRFPAIRLTQTKNNFDNFKFAKFINKVPIETLIAVDYAKWAKLNILSTDIKLSFSELIDPSRCSNFCQKNNLNFNIERINDIKNNLKQYE